MGEIAGVFGRFPQFPNIQAWVERAQARQPYRAALEKGETYAAAR